MGLFRAAIDAATGTLSEQWKEFYTVPNNLLPTAAMFPAVRQSSNSGRGYANDSASAGVITNGSAFGVPEGYALILLEGGAFTGFSSTPGYYIWNSKSLDSTSIFSGDSLSDALVKASWERFKFGGQPASQQRALYVSLKELPDNRFATSSNIYWDDSYLKAQVSAKVRGSMTLRILDPLLFVRNFVPAQYILENKVFDFTDLYNSASQQIFNETVASLSSAFADYANRDSHNHRISGLQQGSAEFAATLSSVVEKSYHWREQRGIEIVNCAIVSLEYDQDSLDLLKTVQRSDALSGGRAVTNAQIAYANALEAAGSTGGMMDMIGIGMLSGTQGSNLFQQGSEPANQEAMFDSDLRKLSKFKQMLDSGLITQDDYEAAKAKILGL